MKQIFIFRHGETDWNKAGRMQGHVDIPLNETGRTQALALQRYFAKHPVDVFLSSDLKRARETAEIARGGLPVPHEIDVRQRETNLGDAEGLTHVEIASKISNDAWLNWAGNEPHQMHYRFPNGETKHEHMLRVRDALTEYLAKTPYNRIGFCSHGGSMRRLITALKPDLVDPIIIPNCTLYEFNYTPEQGLWLRDITPIATT